MKKKQIRTLFFLLFIITACNKLKASEDSSSPRRASEDIHPRKVSEDSTRPRRGAISKSEGYSSHLGQFAKIATEKDDLNNQLKKLRAAGKDTNQCEKYLADLLEKEAALQKELENRDAQANLQQKKS